MRNGSSAKSWEESSISGVEVKFENHSQNLKKIWVERDGKADKNSKTKKWVRNCYENYVKNNWVIFLNAEIKD